MIHTFDDRSNATYLNVDLDVQKGLSSDEHQLLHPNESHHQVLSLDSKIFSELRIREVSLHESNLFKPHSPPKVSLPSLTSGSCTLRLSKITTVFHDSTKTSSVRSDESSRTCNENSLERESVGRIRNTRRWYVTHAFDMFVRFLYDFFLKKKYFREGKCVASF